MLLISNGTIDLNLKEKDFKKGGRIGLAMGSKPMMESVVEQEKETGEVKDLSYTQLRARLPNEISNDIVMLANSKQALLDFANIQTLKIFKLLINNTT